MSMAKVNQTDNIQCDKGRSKENEFFHRILTPKNLGGVMTKKNWEGPCSKNLEFLEIEFFFKC